MSSVNKVILIGNLGGNPELRTTQTGQQVATLSLATNESWTDQQGQKQQRTEWHRVVLWGRQAELAAQFLSKGRSVYIEGKLTTRKWTDQQGQERYTTEIVGSQVVFLSSGQAQDAGAGPSGQARSGPPQQRANEQRMPGGPAPEPTSHFSDEDIPF